MNPTLHIHLLGDFLLLMGDTPVKTIPVSRVQSLLTYVLLHRHAPQDRSRLAFLLWPDSTEAQAHTNLRKLLHQLRQAFPEIERFLHTDNRSVQWLPQADAPWTLDILEFEQALDRADQAEQKQDTVALRSALHTGMLVYSSDLLPGSYDEWLLPERDRLHQLFLAAADRYIALLEQARDYDAAIEVAQRLLRQDSMHEATYRKLMRLYALRGDRAAALRVYHTCVTILERELGTGPGAATQADYESLLHSEALPQRMTGPLAERRTASPLLGRKKEWRLLSEAWRKAANGQPHIFILSGEAGIGKTRLAEEMEMWVNRQGILTANAHCYATEGRLAYAPVTSWLRSGGIQANLLSLVDVWLTEIARLLPEVLIKRPKLPRPVPMTERWQRQHFFEALAHAFLDTSQPLLLLLDDLQWCDTETLEWVHYLCRFEPQARLLIIGTVRAEEASHPLVAFLGALQREGLVTEVALGPLSTSETTSLAEHILGQPLDEGMGTTLYAETEGNPLFIVEMARSGTLEQTGTEVTGTRSPQLLLSQIASTLPPTVQSVLMTRLAQLSPSAREIANVAAVIGRDFPFAVLALASGESEDSVVVGLDELWQRRIVREQGAGIAETYEFSHDKLRELAYASLSPAYRRLLHRRIAEAFETVFTTSLFGEETDLDAVSGQIAVHFERAGQPERAIAYYRRTGEAALRVYANADAIAAFQHAVTLLKAASSRRVLRGPGWKETATIYCALGDILAMTGRQQEARQVYSEGIAALPPHSGLAGYPGEEADARVIWQARLLRKMAITWNLASANPLETFHVTAQETFQEAERTLAQVVDKTSIEWLQEWIALQIDLLLPLRGTVEEMTAIIEKAQEIVARYGTPEQRSQFFQAVVARDSQRDRYVVSEESLLYCRQALVEVHQTGNPSLIGFAHFVLGNRLLWLDQLEEAEKEMRAAIHIAEQIGNTRLLARCLMFLPFIYRRSGQVEAVREVVAQALALPEARNIPLISGHRAWLAWKDGNLAEAKAFGLASLEDRNSQQRTNAFLWGGLWPLIGVALAAEDLHQAVQYVRLLLDPTQQLLSEPLRIRLEAALQGGDAGNNEKTRAFLQQAMHLAEDLGYL